MDKKFLIFERLYLKTIKYENLFFIRFRTLRNNMDEKMETAVFEKGGGVSNLFVMIIDLGRNVGQL